MTQIEIERPKRKWERPDWHDTLSGVMMFLILCTVLFVIGALVWLLVSVLGKLALLVPFVAPGIFGLGWVTAFIFNNFVDPQ